MPGTRSINQNIQHKLLPNFRNLGTVLRIVVLVNAAAFFVALTRASSPADLTQQMLYESALLQPVLLTGLLALYMLDRFLGELSYRRGAAITVSIIVLLTLLLDILGGDLFASPADFGAFRYWRHALEGAIVTWLLLSYFRWRALALSPARQEARLQALQARIRPHFLFNSINAVLGIVRADPKLAETALEDMGDLFRMAMAVQGDLVALSKEIRLTRQYLALEKLRLGERLQVRWDIDSAPNDALIPPLILQPLLENAVYHGIEPMAAGGAIDVSIRCEEQMLHLEVSNPVAPSAAPKADGNKMALSNIRERLSLLFDVEADYRVEQSAGTYRVHIAIPYVKEGEL